MCTRAARSACGTADFEPAALALQAPAAALPTCSSSAPVRRHAVHMNRNHSPAIKRIGRPVARGPCVGAAAPSACPPARAAAQLTDTCQMRAWAQAADCRRSQRRVHRHASQRSHGRMPAERRAPAHLPNEAHCRLLVPKPRIHESLVRLTPWREEHVREPLAERPALPLRAMLAARLPKAKVRSAGPIRHRACTWGRSARPPQTPPTRAAVCAGGWLLSAHHRIGRVRRKGAR